MCYILARNRRRTMLKVYLAGYISGEKIEECVQWRNNIEKSIWGTNDIEKIKFLNPLNVKEMGSIDKAGLTSNIPAEGIMHRDYMSVKEADLIIANMDTFGAARPLTGTLFELAWAYEWRKPVIVITEDPNFKFHPFITETASMIVPSVEKLLEEGYIEYFRAGKDG